MKKNQNAIGKDWRWRELWREARQLSAADIKLLEDQLRVDQSNMDVRVQLFSHYDEYEGNNLKHDNAEQKLFEQVLWLIENKPGLRGFMGSRIASTGDCFKPRTFAIAREAWLEQVSVAPVDGAILGNAGSFIAWRDFETASGLIERAYQLQPTEGWLGTFVIHCHSELWRAPSIYKEKIYERIIEVGVRSLKSEPDGAPFLTCECVSDAALGLGRYEIVRWCAEILCKWNDPACAQTANAYLGLVALRENHLDLAIQLMSEMKRGYGPQHVVFRLATELFDVGERDSIIQLIGSFKNKIKTSTRDRWLEQIANNAPPDFKDYCC
jgi:hypothetical protein